MIKLHLIFLLNSCQISNIWEINIYLHTYLRIYLLNYLHAYLLTPRRRILVEKLTGPQLVKKFPSFYEILEFITASTRARHLSQS